MRSRSLQTSADHQCSRLIARSRLFAAALAALLPLATGCADPTGQVAPFPQTASAPPAAPAPTTSTFIYVASADGSGATLLTRGEWPAWSPDGRRVAFNGENGQIYVIDADGSGLAWLAEGRWPSWSPDGRRLVFTGRDGIAVMNADGSGARTLVGHEFARGTYQTGELLAALPAWSPDGAQVAFALSDVDGGVPLAVYVMNADGTDLRALPEKNEPSWAPDGSRLVLVDYTDGLSITLADPQRVQPDVRFRDPAGGGVLSKPVWSPDGLSIAFTGSRPNEVYAVWVMSATGTGARVLVADAAQPAWSPDGKRIAFVRVTER